MKLIITESQYRTLVEAPPIKNDYSPENIRKVASQYTGRTEFFNGAKSFYDKAIDMMDELFPDSQRRKLTQEEEDEIIEDIISYVKKGNRVSTHPEYEWFKSRTRSDKNTKFKNVANQINKIQIELGIKREWWGERTIKDILIGMGFENIPQQGQHIYKDCRNSLTCKLYKFDIYLPYNENNYMVGKDKDFYIPETGIIFEYDGVQHFKSIEHFGGEEGFKQRIHSDKEKNLYCQNNNIKLVRISYTTNTYHEINHAVFYGLKSKNTNGNIITTGDYPQLGWNQK